MKVRQEAAATALTDLLFEEPGAGRCLLAPDGRVLRVNGEWLRSAGRALDEATGADAVALFPETRDVALALHARARAGRRVEVPRHPRRIDGRETWWEGSIAPVPMEGGTGLLVTLHEVAGEGRPGVEEQERVASEARLNASRLRTLISTLPVGVTVSDAAGRFTLVNDEANAILGGVTGDVGGPSGGYTLERPAGGPFPPAELPLVRALRGEATRSVEMVAKRADGTERVLLAAGAPVRDGRGAIDGAIAVLQDITDRKRAELALRASEERFRLLTEAMPQIVCVLGADGRPEYVNTSWVAFSGLDLAATMRAGWEGVLHPDDLPAAYECRRRALKTLRPQDVEVRYRAADGSHRWFLSRLAPVVADGRVVRLVGAAMDIDDRKRMEAALRDEDRRKTEFLGVLSHELRNPLAPIRNSIYLLERAAPGSEQATRAREVIRRQTEHLTRLIDDLLDVTRISRGKIALQRARVDLREIVRKTTDDVLSVFAYAGVALHVDYGAPGPVWIDADPTRIAQVIGNLLHNAVKFTPGGGAVAVSVVAQGGRAELRVRDDGIGMEPATIERMFEPFAQADQTLARTNGGLGLGLALVKGLVELHGGTVEARSEGIGRGAAFAVRLPLSESGRAAGEDALPAARTQGRLVLVIEDNADAGQSLAEILELHGHRVRVARDGRSGLALARELAPDVVLCDIGLPDLDGYEVARTLRRDAALRSMRLVALSGYAQPEDRERALAAGFDVHLAKPADLDTLAKALVGGSGARPPGPASPPATPAP
jgi:PAS domain S-box-containing protein